MINDDPDSIQGLPFDIVTTVISSFKSEEQRKKKLKYKGNIEIDEYEKNGTRVFDKPSYIKADKLFYFNKEKLDYYVFGRITDDLLDELIKIIIELSNSNQITQVTNNL